MTKKEGDSTRMQSLVRCKTCDDLRPSADFYIFKKPNGTWPDTTCKRCRRDAIKTRRNGVVNRPGRAVAKRPERLTQGGMTGAERRAFWATHKASIGCADCGETDWRVLEFDHLPQFKKDFTIGEAMRSTGYYTDQQIAQEVAKCEVVCSACHHERTQHRCWELRAVTDSPSDRDTGGAGRHVGMDAGNDDGGIAG